MVYPSRDELLLLHYKYLGVEYLTQRNALLDTGLLAPAIAPTIGANTMHVERAQIEGVVEDLWRRGVDFR